MRLLLVTALVMVSLAANSNLNRLALIGGDAGALDFAAIRVASGAAALGLLILLRGNTARPSARTVLIGTGALLVYMFGFSLGYLGLDPGAGALILFGCTQVTMFAGGLIGGERPSAPRWAGAGLALAGLAWMCWPTETIAFPLWAALLMALAGVGWGIYSLNGRGTRDPLAATAINFIAAAPVCIAVALLWPDPTVLTGKGILLAVFSGVVTSGLGYALWYQVLPQLDSALAAIAQLTVPVIALAGGVLFLGEVVTTQSALAAALVLSGVALGALRKRAG